MNSTDYAYMGIGLIVAIAGFLLYAAYTFRAYKDEKKKIEEDFSLSQKYRPEEALSKVLFFIVYGSTGVVYTCLTMTLTMLFGTDALPLATSLLAKYVLIMGLSTLIADLARTPVAMDAARDLVYSPSIEPPEDIKNIKDIYERSKKEMEFYKSHGLRAGSWNFGRHVVVASLPETQLVYSFLIFVLLSIFTGLLGDNLEGDITQAFAGNMFLAGLVFVVLSSSAILSMKKCTEIPMEEFGKRVMVALSGYIPGIIGLAIMMYVLVQLIS